MQSSEERAAQDKRLAENLSKIKYRLVVISGKGGVGKTTVSVNLAYELANRGYKVGLMDADIHGPNIIKMLGAEGVQAYGDGKLIQPVKITDNLSAMSIALLTDDPDKPIIWRGPLKTGIIKQFISDVNWGELDYLIIDSPPGTGDEPLSVIQLINGVDGAIIVTTPQAVAILDSRKSVRFAEELKVPVVGIIENMSTHICSECGHEEHIFGSGGGDQMAKQYDVDLLGSLPLDIRIREGVDQGKPTVAMEPDSEISMNYRDIARRTSAKLALQAKDYTAKFPKIVIENN